MRLIARRDTSLVVALVAGTLILFERPFRWLLDLTHDIETRYQVDLLPALTLMVMVFVFHQYKKRLQAKMALAALASEMAEARAHTQGLERLISFGQALGNAVDRPALAQVLSRTLPQFIGDRECAVLWRHPGGLDALLTDVRMQQRRPAESLEDMVQRAAAAGCDADLARHGVDDGEDVCVPMFVAGQVAGAIIVRNEPRLSERERTSLGAAGALIAVAARNAHLLQDARQSGVRDGLTGCVTRAHALEVLQGELRRAARTKRPVSLIMFDIDNFKAINDSLGHLQGDAVLASVGAQLNEVLRSTDVRCRYGGDEFLLILPDTPVLGAQQVAECIRREIAAVPRDQAGHLIVTASLGVASAQPGELDPTAIIGRADEALYRAKRAGRNQYSVSTNASSASLTPVATPAQDAATAFVAHLVAS